MRRVLIVQTAFLGDVILTLPLAQALCDRQPSVAVDFLVVPRSAPILSHHPAIHGVIAYDKHGDDAGWRGFLSIVKRIRASEYDAALIPHRSIRSASLVRLAGIPKRVGFSNSAGRILYTRVVEYRRELHEIDRNLSLLLPLGLDPPGDSLPTLHPDDVDRSTVDALLEGFPRERSEALVGIAPGTVWNTKRWPEERFALLIKMLRGHGMTVILVGGSEDRELCNRIIAAVGDRGCISAAGELGLLGSAELIRRCALVVTNDSAPMHIAVAMRVPVIAIYGATIPAFGFAPRGPRDQIAEVRDLPCRPCSRHGSDQCPIGTFDCMLRVSPEYVLQLVLAAISRRVSGGG